MMPPKILSSSKSSLGNPRKAGTALLISLNSHFSSVTQTPYSTILQLYMALEETWKISVCLNSKNLYCFVLFYNTKPSSDAQSLNSHHQSRPEIIQVAHGCSE